MSLERGHQWSPRGTCTGLEVFNTLINGGSTFIHKLLRKQIPSEQYIKRTSDNVNPTRMESYIFVINLLQKGFKRGSGRHIIESTKRTKERTSSREDTELQ